MVAGEVTHQGEGLLPWSRGVETRQGEGLLSWSRGEEETHQGGLLPWSRERRLTREKVCYHGRGGGDSPGRSVVMVAGVVTRQGEGLLSWSRGW